MGCVHGKLFCNSCCFCSSSCDRDRRSGGDLRRNGDDHGNLCCCCCCCCCKGGCRDSSGKDKSVYPAAGGVAGAGGGGEGRRLLHLGSFVGSAAVPSCGILLQYSTLTQRGHYPDSPERENQDSFVVRSQIQGSPDAHLFGVFDGHGQFGTQCAQFARDRLVDNLAADPRLLEDPARAYRAAFLATNAQLHESPVDDSLSGTTAITVLVSSDTLYVANVGDSRAVAGVRKGGGREVVAEDLSCDQTPFRKDEYERVKLCGARVLSVDQVEGIKDPDVQSWGNEESDDGDPPRLWLPDGMYPGTAFTRSVGDSTAESIGVVADPEVLALKLTPEHLFFVIASDGVFEFLPSQAVVDIVAKFMDPRDACAAVTAESCRLWLENESRIDDITIIIVYIKALRNSGDEASEESSQASKKNSSGSLGSFQNGRSAPGHQSRMESFPIRITMERGPSSVAPSPVHECA